MKVILGNRDPFGRWARLAEQIAADYRGRPLTVLGVLTGSLIFLSDLIRQLNLPLQVGLIQASSYPGAHDDSGSPDDRRIGHA